MNELYLHEQILLLALHDEKGTVPLGMSTYAIAGAIIAELLLRKRIRILETKRSKKIEVVSGAPVGENLVDETLERIRTAKKAHTLGHWVSRIAHTKRLQARISERLRDRGVLDEEDRKVLFLFTRTVYPEADGDVEDALVARMRAAIFEATVPDARTAIVIALAHATDLLDQVFDRKRLKAAKDRVEAIANGDVVAAATRETIDAVQAAVIVCTMAATTAATTAAVAAS